MMIAYTFEMMNCIVELIKYAKWEIRWVILILIDVELGII